MPVAFQPSHKRSGPKYQSGVGLLIFFIVLFSVAATVTLSALNNRIAARTDNNTVYPELLEAKEALLAFAMFHTSYSSPSYTYNNGPGRLPCPDTSNNGLPDHVCQNITGINRLPREFRYATIPAPPAAPPPAEFVFTTRNDDSRFWYVLSPGFGFRATGSTTALNTSTAGNLTLNGDSGIVALIIDTGAAVGNQTRPNSNRANYLEGDNQTGNDFVTVPPSTDEFNDRFVVITESELRAAMTFGVARSIMQILKTTPSPIIDASELPQAFNTAGIGWYNTEQWHQRINFFEVNSDGTSEFNFKDFPNSCYTFDATNDIFERSTTGCIGP